MSRLTEVSCGGAPRDLGLDQGRAARSDVRARVGRVRGGALTSWLRALRDDPQVVRVERDAMRFFPHMAERAAGLARGAGVSTRDLAALLARTQQPDAGAVVAVAPERSGENGWVAVALPGAGPWLLRRSLPDSDHASLEVARPWLVPACAGVNAVGLAVAGTVPSGAVAEGDCQAPAALLVQDCLQRFDTVDKAVEWCSRRRAGGRFAVLLVDATGDAARVLVDGPARRVERPRDGLLVAAAAEARSVALEKACAASGAPGFAALHDVFRAAGVAAATLLLVDPSGRRLGLWPAGESGPEWHAGPEAEESAPLERALA